LQLGQFRYQNQQQLLQQQQIEQQQRQQTMNVTHQALIDEAVQAARLQARVPSTSYL
jgi:hypothetical protein